jgi:outer membrane protein
MKHLKSFLIAAALVIGVSSFTNAQSKVAHINTQNLIEAMPEMKSAKAELEKLAKSYENDIRTMATELENLAKQYDAEAATKTQEENTKRMQEVATKEQSIRQYQAQAQQELAAKEKELLEPILTKAKDAVVKVAKGLGYQYVLDSTSGQGVILAEGYDLFADVKAELGF